MAATSAETLSSIDPADYLNIEFDNESDPECTVITVEGKDQSDLLMSLTGAFNSTGIAVVTASIKTDDGKVFDIFRVTTAEGDKLPKERWEEIKQQILGITSTSSRSTKPAIYGIVAAAEVKRLRPLSSNTSAQNDAASLELAAAELAQAAAELVAIERDIMKLAKKNADATSLAVKESLRSEAAASLERKMAAMEAVLTARRAIHAGPVEPPEQGGSILEQMKQMTGAPTTQAPTTTIGTGPAAGNGYHVLFQAFNWESHKNNWYKTLEKQVPDIAKAGFTSVWLPPPSDSVSPQGYLPRDLYQLDCCYGSEGELRDLISTFHSNNIKVLADIVVNHRCAHNQDSSGKWNKFGGRLAWDASAICCNNPEFGGRGNHKTGDDYTAAPNIDHTNDRVRQDIIDWMRWLRNGIGFDGWRFDFVRGYNGQYAKIYIDATVPEMAIGEYWDTCDYTDGVLNYNQDAHRQRTINWCDSSGGTCAAFDFTTKGILQEALARGEYWRLIDSQGRPPGVMGMWPSRAITFIDNHDTGSTLNHWPFPGNHLHQGYAYILTHPGTPTVFYDHFYQEQGGLRKAILELMAIRKRNGINCRSRVVIKKASNDSYAAVVDDKVAMKIGYGNWSPNSANIQVGQKEWKLGSSGPNFAVWEAVF